MNEWIEIRKDAKNEVSKLLRDKATLLQERRELFSSGAISEDKRERIVELNIKLTRLERKEYTIRGQITVMDKMLNYDYPFELGRVIEVQHNLNIIR